MGKAGPIAQRQLWQGELHMLAPESPSKMEHRRDPERIPRGVDRASTFFTVYTFSYVLVTHEECYLRIKHPYYHSQYFISIPAI